VLLHADENVEVTRRPSVEAGFSFHHTGHHTGQDYLMLTHRLLEGAFVPPYASHYIGAGGVVLNTRSELLVVCERHRATSALSFKLPGGALQHLIEPARNAFFLSTAGAINLPWAYIAGAVVSVLATIVLRWIVQRHEHHLEMRGWARWGRQALLVSGVVLLGATPGTWSQMPRSAHQALRDVYALATHTLAQAADAPLPTEFNFAPNLRAHAGVPFVMDQRPAKATAQSVDVRLLFADGYIVTCLVTPEFEQMFCAEGKP